MTVSIVFMGTPDFAVPPLLALHKAGYSIPLVVSQPDRPKGRGRKLEETPVKKAAMELGIPVIQPQKINTDDTFSIIEALKPDFFVVVAFGQIIGERLLSIPKFAPINIHASLLPDYRGAAPIQRAILGGESLTGVTTMRMDRGMDTGDMLLVQTMAILDDDTTETLGTRLARLGATLIVQTIEDYKAGRISPRPQDHEKATYAPMLSKQEGRINWQHPAEQLDCFVRGMDPWPGAFTFLGDKRFRIIKAMALDIDGNAPPGTVLDSAPGTLVIQAGKGSLSIREIQGESGKRLPIGDFLRGFPVPKASIFE